MIRIVIVEGMGLFRGALRAVIAIQPDLEVVAEVAEPVGIPELVVRTCPDVVLVNLE